MIGKTIMLAILALAALFVIGWGGVKVWHLIRRETDAERRAIREETEEFRDAEYSLDRAMKREGSKRKERK